MTQRKRILFGKKPEWERTLRASADPARFEIVMADLTQAETTGFDAIIPMDLPDHAWLERSGRALPALTVPKALRELCHDKPHLNLRLIALGFSDNVPAMRDELPGDLRAHPVILKARRSAWGRDTQLVLGPPVADEVLGRLAAGTHFLQDYIPGRIEYAAHVLMHRGQPQMWQCRAYEMGDHPVVKGVAHQPVATRPLAEPPGAEVLERILAAIGFHTGTCCIDYRMVEDRPLLFEINPRFGASLCTNVSPYLDAYLACLARDAGTGAWPG